MFKALETIKSFGVGGMLGSAILSILSVLCPQIFPVGVGICWTLAVGALFGAGLQRVFEPATKFCAYYFRIFELTLLTRHRIITQGQKKELVKKLTKCHFAPPNDDEKNSGS